MEGIMKKTYVRFENGKLADIMLTRENHGEPYILVPNEFGGRVGDKQEWFDEKYYRIPDEKLAKQGKRIDNTGIWYNKETKEPKVIKDLDVEIDKNEWTKKMPIDNEDDKPYQFFDKQKDDWAVDEKKKEAARIERETAKKQMQLDKMQAEIATAEQKQLRSLKAIARNEADDEDVKKFNEYENIILELRPKIAALEEELKSA